MVLCLQEHQQAIQLCSHDTLDQLAKFVSNFGASGKWLYLVLLASMCMRSFDLDASAVMSETNLTIALRSGGHCFMSDLLRAISVVACEQAACRVHMKWLAGALPGTIESERSVTAEAGTRRNAKAVQQALLTSLQAWRGTPLHQVFILWHTL